MRRIRRCPLRFALCRPKPGTIGAQGRRCLSPCDVLSGICSSSLLIVSRQNNRFSMVSHRVTLFVVESIRDYMGKLVDAFINLSCQVLPPSLSRRGVPPLALRLCSLLLLPFVFSSSTLFVNSVYLFDSAACTTRHFSARFTAS